MKLLQEKTIKIADKDYPVRMSIRAMIEFEELAGHSISAVETLHDMVILFYVTIKAGGAKDMGYTQFLDLIDDKPEALAAFSELMLDGSAKKKK